MPGAIAETTGILYSQTFRWETTVNDMETRLLLYQLIYNDVRNKIEAGQLKVHDHLPSLPDLCEQYNVSQAPVRRALDELARDGLIVKMRGRGKGTIVTRRPIPATLRVLLVAGINLQKSSIEACHEVFDLLGGIEHTADELGCQVQQVSINGFDNLSSPAPMTGYLVIATTNEEYQQGLHLASLHGVPVVLLNPPCAGGFAVRVDMEQGGFAGADYLASLGHWRIAYVGDTLSAWGFPRFQGYLRALAKHGLAFDDALVRNTNGIDTGQDWQALASLMALPNPPTAVFASSDYRALHLLSYCKQNRIAVPEQLSICGYDNIREVSGVIPALTTVHHPRQELGKIAVHRLLGLLCRRQDGLGDLVVDEVIPPTLIIRASCAPPASI